MSEEATNPEQKEPEQTQKVELPKEVQEQLAELERLKSHHTKLLDETKSAKQKAAELEAAQQEAETKRQQEKGEFKELWESEQREKQELSEKFSEFQTRIQKQEISATNAKLVSELTRDTSRAELLAEKAQQFAKYTEDGVVYEMGGLKVEPEKIVNHLKEKYPFLIDGSGAAGGGATGAGRPSGASDTNQAAQAARQKGDLKGFLAAQLNQ